MDSPLAILLAAGKGTRMNTNLPKVMQPLGGQTLISHVIQTAKENSENITIVVGYKKNILKTHIANIGQNNFVSLSDCSNSVVASTLCTAGIVTESAFAPDILLQGPMLQHIQDVPVAPAQPQFLMQGPMLHF